MIREEDADDHSTHGNNLSGLRVRGKQVRARVSENGKEQTHIRAPDDAGALNLLNQRMHKLNIFRAQGSAHQCLTANSNGIENI